MKNLDEKMEKITGKRTERQRQEIIENRRELREAREETHSLAYDMLQEFKALNKRLFIVIVVILGLWFATIFGFVWYLNQYDFEAYDFTTDGGGNANFIGNDGEIYNGTNENSIKDKEEQQK